MPIHFAVVVDARTAAAPFGIDVRFCRQQQQRAAFGCLEQRTSTSAEMAHRAIVERFDQFADRAVQLGQREKPLVPQPSQHSTLHELNGYLEARCANGCLGLASAMAGQLPIRAKSG